MPYPSGHRAEIKAKIIQSARRLFNRHGFDSVSLDQIMSGAGLTRGGFYSYFESKSDLYAEVLGCFFTDPEWKSCWEGVEVDLSSKDVGPQVVRAYLSRQHFEDVENSCPMVALPTDVIPQRRKCEAGVRDRVQRDGQRSGAQLEAESPCSPHPRTSHCRFMRGWHGGGAGSAESKPCRWIARRMHVCGARAWWMG